MAKSQSKPNAPAIPTNSLVASAVRFPKNSARIYHKTGADWQAECYRHYSICGEARFAARFFGHAMSRARLFVDNPDNGDLEVEAGEAYDLLHTLFNGQNGQAQMLESIGIHLTVAGECFLIGRTVDGGEIWEIVSPLEVTVVGEKWFIDYGADQEHVELSPQDVVIRIWNPRPGRRMEADSPYRSLLPILSEIEWLTRHVFAQISSRLAGAGILFLPQGMTFPPAPEVNGKAVEVANEADAFMLSLADSMMTPIDDPSSPSALIPNIVMAPGEEIDKAKLMTFWTELDAAAMDLRNEALRRFALGMDLPPEQILGMSSGGGTGGGTGGGVSHWGAWQIEEATIKMHIEPMLGLITNALTIAYIRPSLEEPTNEFITYDTSELRLRPDRSKEALELNDRGLVSDDVVLRETGFDVLKDAMSPDQRKDWLLRKIASGSATPEQVGAALKALGVDLGLPDALDPANPQDASDMRESRPAPSLDQHPSKPRTPDESALLAACDGLVWRALEKAGNRHLNSATRGKDRDKSIDPTRFHCMESINGQGPTLLAGAFTYAPRVLDGIADPWETVSMLQTYCLGLFSSQSEHSRERLREYLEVNR